MAKTTEAQAKACKKYQQANTKLMSMRLNLTTDLDIIQRLDEVESKQGYIKALIRADIANKGHI